MAGKRLKRLPPRRIDLAGKTEEIFRAQWAGNLDPLRDALARRAGLKRRNGHGAMPFLSQSQCLIGRNPAPPALHEAEGQTTMNSCRARQRQAP
jgi:hypothetical protein